MRMAAQLSEVQVPPLKATMPLCQIMYGRSAPVLLWTLVRTFARRLLNPRGSHLVRVAGKAAYAAGDYLGSCIHYTRQMSLFGRDWRQSSNRCAAALRCGLHGLALADAQARPPPRFSRRFIYRHSLLYLWLKTLATMTMRPVTTILYRCL